MFDTVRLRLTALYLIAGLVLVVLLGAGAYSLLNFYFRATTDLALQHRMAHELVFLNAPVPAELVAADRAWATNRSRLLPFVPTPEPERRDANGNDRRERELTWPVGDGDRPEDIEAEQEFDGELAAIFVLPVGNTGNLLPGGTSAPMVPDATAAAEAMTHGWDIRTIQLASGVPVRLLSYPVERSAGPTVLQLGRTLIDQNRVLNALLLGLVSLGGVSTMLLGGASYWLAGRSLRPAQHAWHQQQTFVTNASHELRAPLTLIRASADVARRTTSDSSSHELLDDILQECDHMARLVDDLLTMSQLDARALPFHNERIELQPFLDSIARKIDRVASERGIFFTTAVTEGTIHGDPTRLRQVILIIIDNALRHTPSGGTISLETEVQRDHMRILIKDTGNGIVPEHLPHLFERFYRVDSTRTEPDGTGIGLSLALALMRAQNGDIHITSRLGEGTCVTLLLSSPL